MRRSRQSVIASKTNWVARILRSSNFVGLVPRDRSSGGWAADDGVGLVGRHGRGTRRAMNATGRTLFTNVRVFDGTGGARFDGKCWSRTGASRQ